MVDDYCSFYLDHATTEYIFFSTKLCHCARVIGENGKKKITTNLYLEKRLYEVERMYVDASAVKVIRSLS